jgi:hypothetical protein
MRFTAVANCCTARNLCNLPYDGPGPWNKPLDKDLLIKKLGALKENGVAIVHCYLNSAQMKSLHTLKKLGFKCSKPVQKTVREVGTDLFILYLRLDTFNKGN